MRSGGDPRSTTSFCADPNARIINVTLSLGGGRMAVTISAGNRQRFTLETTAVSGRFNSHFGQWSHRPGDSALEAD